MYQIDKAENCYHIIAEPGDVTRYDFLVYRDGPDDFCFAPAGSTMLFPQRINKWDVKHLMSAPDSFGPTTVEVRQIADKYHCSPHTVVVCINTMKRLLDME